MKKCKDCVIEKPLDEYYKNPGGKDGYQNRCKECSKRAKRESNHRTGVHAVWHKGEYGPPAPAMVKGWSHKGRWHKKKLIVPPLREDSGAAIYVLRREGEIFYAGSTTRPKFRINQHRRKWGFDIEMEILRWVPREIRIIEEMREIIYQYEQGHKLMNSGVPTLYS